MRTALAAYAFLLATALPLLAAEEVPDTPRPATLDWVVQELRKETAGSWQRDRTFPRNKPDFTADRRVTLDHADIYRALIRPLHHEPAIDAYLRRQLLGFKPDLTGLAAPQYTLLIKSLPRLRPLQQPGQTNPLPNQNAAVGTASPTPSVVNEGAALDVTAWVSASDPRYVTLTTQASQADVIRIRRIARKMSQPAQGASPLENAQVLAYRDALIERLPPENGVRVLARFQDLRDRFDARDPSTPRAAEALARECEHLDQLHLDEPTRRTLQGWTQTLARLNAARAADPESPPLIPPNLLMQIESDLQRAADPPAINTE